MHKLINAWLLLAVAAIIPHANVTGQAAPKPNIILIVMDDLNDYVEGYGGHPQTSTPNIKTIADQGTLFYNAFCSAPLCAPSRTSFLTGKDVEYTQTFTNAAYNCHDFRSNIPADHYVETLPQYLKDSAGYFTIGMNKIFHCDQWFPDYDAATPDPCARSLSWSLEYYCSAGGGISTAGEGADEDIPQFHWAKIDSDFTTSMEDYRCADSAIAFINEYATDPSNFCSRPFFLAVGMHRPHQDLYVPAEYYPDYYIGDFYSEPYVIPYNVPVNAYPYNGIVMPPQPVPMWSDYDSLSYLGQKVAAPYVNNGFEQWVTGLPYFPVINDTLTDDERSFILGQSKRANAIMAYLAAIKFVDEQVGRIYAALQANPALLNNTILIVTSDHGYSLGEKKHWMKNTLWETDIRVPFIITDFRHVHPQTCNRVVGLIDMYPTLCDYAGVPMPHMPDGSPYLDGYSLRPLMQHPDRAWERPMLTTAKKDPGDEASCYPQYSVRNERFHYIRYTSNNIEGSWSICDEAVSFHSEELYEIGAHREVDPNEWNNLIDDPDYQPVVHYMQQFLPDSSLYLQKVFFASILSSDLPCLSTASDIVKLKARLYNPDGSAVSATALSGYTFTWSNNLTMEVATGQNFVFHMASISPAVFNANQRIMFYLTVTDAGGNEVAFDTKYIYINPDNLPLASFAVNLDAATAGIMDYNLTGTYNSTSWDFNDGFTTNDFIPAPHTYASPGLYKIRNLVYYGNLPTCRKTFSHTVSVTGPPEMKSPEAACNLYPDPASDFVLVEGDAVLSADDITVFDITGHVVRTEKPAAQEYAFRIDVRTLPAGTYFVRMRGPQYTIIKQFEIIGH